MYLLHIYVVQSLHIKTNPTLSFPYSEIAGKSFTSQVRGLPMAMGLARYCTTFNQLCGPVEYFTTRYVFNEEGNGYQLFLGLDLPLSHPDLPQYNKTQINTGSIAKHQAVLDSIEPNTSTTSTGRSKWCTITPTTDDPHVFISNVYQIDELFKGMGYMNTGIRFNEDFTQLRTCGPKGGPMLFFADNPQNPPGFQILMYKEELIYNTSEDLTLSKMAVRNGWWLKDPFCTDKELVMYLGKSVPSGGDETST